MPPGRKAFRAKDEIRTRDPNLGKVVLYQLSYFRRITSSDVVSVLFNSSSQKHEILKKKPPLVKKKVCTEGGNRTRTPVEGTGF